ncbi:hypothetical protein CLH62_18165 [Marinobacter guineae]|uniref:Uncharacterized protein n=1 Tax=Marinobacter guineae TaxID=432303 RepID=A0A2G1VB93_9GAMM|nr:hypothetical protein [Marinobacter guineae]PHQ24041.1 hypothetical protein CLH62_18165 [Marinobacter guineae]
MDLVSNFLSSLDPTSILIGAIFSALIGLWLDFFIKQPKLQRNGSGSGGVGRGFKQNSLTFTNKVGWFGINLRESRILGLRIHPGFRKGLTFDKHPARDCRAHLFLKSTGESVGQLWWNVEGNRVDDKVTLESGKQASLIIFCRQSDDENYFVYQPTSREDKTPKVPDHNFKFVGEQEFVLKVNYSHSRKYEENILIEKKYNGLLYFKTKNGSSLF